MLFGSCSQRFGRTLSFPDLSQYSVVSWDVDGTLYSMPAMASTITWLGVTRILNAEVRQTVEEYGVLRRFRYQMEKVRDHGGALKRTTGCKPLRDRLSIEHRWYGEAIRRIGMRNGVREAMDKFRQAGLLQIAISDYECSYKLNALGLDGSFDHVYAGENLGFLKPSPGLFTAVTDQLGINPARLLHIGDRRDRDGIAASKAGCTALILGENFRSFPQLLKSLEQ